MKYLIPITLLFILLLNACKTIKPLDASTQKVILEARVRQLIQCLNEQDATCLNNIYADDFKSISPIMEITSKSNLIDRTLKGFKDNQFTADVMIEEVYTADKLGYVVLEYRLYQPGEGSATDLFYQQKRLDVWEHHTAFGWQLKRSLFYDPKKF